jgi:hypothetical protein
MGSFMEKTHPRPPLVQREGRNGGFAAFFWLPPSLCTRGGRGVSGSMVDPERDDGLPSVRRQGCRRSYAPGSLVPAVRMRFRFSPPSASSSWADLTFRRAAPCEVFVPSRGSESKRA